MITLIEALNFRCFKYIRQPLGPFHVLVGPNASGKSAFLDILVFLNHFMNDGLERAVKNRMGNFFDLVYGRIGESFEIAIEAIVPDSVKSTYEYEKDYIRYAIRFVFDTEKNEYRVDSEQCWLFSEEKSLPYHRLNSLLWTDIEGTFPYIYRRQDNSFPYNDVFTVFSPTSNDRATFVSRFDYSSLIHCDPRYLPTEFVWLKNFLANAMKKVELVNSVLYSPSLPGAGIQIKSDGSNLPWVVEDFQIKHPEMFEEWVQHLQTSLPDLVSIRTFFRPEDHTRYIMLKYKNEVEIPSWCVSEGTLRLIALTLIVYLPDNNYVYLIEEPENGIHPQAIETVMQSLQSVYDGQVFITTHSPLILNMVKLDQILCFTKDENGVHIVNGKDHPVLKEWRNEVSLGTLFASGVMG